MSTEAAVGPVQKVWLVWVQVFDYFSLCLIPWSWSCLVLGQEGIAVARSRCFSGKLLGNVPAWQSKAVIVPLNALVPEGAFPDWQPLASSPKHLFCKTMNESCPPSKKKKKMTGGRGNLEKPRNHYFSFPVGMGTHLYTAASTEEPPKALWLVPSPPPPLAAILWWHLVPVLFF